MGYVARGRTWDLYRVPFDGAGAPTLLLDTPGDIQWPSFSADGRWVVFCERHASGQTDILAHRFQPDTVTVTLVASPAYECRPDLSPDGRWLAYVSRESGREEVYVRPFESPSETRWQLTTSTATAAPSGPVSSVGTTFNLRWSWSGRELFLVNDRRELVSVPVAAGPGFAFGPPRVLFPLEENTDWSGEVLPGDRGFIMIRRKREAPGQVVMIRNFERLLREKLGG